MEPVAGACSVWLPSVAILEPPNPPPVIRSSGHRAPQPRSGRPGPARPRQIGHLRRPGELCDDGAHAAVLLVVGDLGRGDLVEDGNPPVATSRRASPRRRRTQAAW